MPIPLRKRKKDQAALALRERHDGQHLGERPALAKISGVNALSIAIRYLPGGKARFQEFVKLAAMNGDPIATAWWTVFADLTKTERDRCNYDDVAAAAGVKPSALLAAMVGHGMEASTDVGNLVAAAFHPEVVAASAKSALRINGEHAEIAAEDRRQLLQARGFLPVPKGASINIHANASANAQAAAVAGSDPSVPKFSNDIAALTAPRADVQRRLAATDPNEQIIDHIPESVEA